MEIGIFNQTNEKLDKELDELKDMLSDFCKREDLGNVIFNIIIIDNPTIHKINKEYRDKDAPTDVISFALEDDKTVIEPDGVRILGDIYISIDKVHEQALEYGHSFKRELSFLAVHGLLHLLGYDHMEKSDEEVMFKKQEEVLNYYEIYK
ncbi:MAG: rRNA maturation RNase YbeY [Bacilli bacterium]|jgi:metalloprotein, YbeY family|nr:rRNA maturation RNase YbeY [Bacilli bacterium]CCZ58504.1 probable rRNA maturation factor [Clostridium sp. CAG:710]